MKKALRVLVLILLVISSLVVVSCTSNLEDGTSDVLEEEIDINDEQAVNVEPELVDGIESEEEATNNMNDNNNETQGTIEKTEGVRPVALMYHHLDPAEDGSNMSVIGLEEFAMQMAYLAENNYTAMTVTEWMTAKAVPEKTVIITIDDGYESVYTYMLPILVEYDIKASIYPIVASTPGEKNTPGIPHLTWEQMQHMVDTGLIEIGSHTYDLHFHIDGPVGRGSALVTKKWLSELERYETDAEFRDRAREDLALSKELLEENLGIEVTSFAYPYGRWTDEVEEIGKEVGFKYFLTLDPQVQNEDQMTRVNVPPGLTLEEFVKLLDQD